MPGAGIGRPAGSPAPATPTASGAAGVGVGFFLYQANHDRKHMAQELETTIQQAQLTREESEQAILAANQKVFEADAEVNKAQDLIRLLEEEREFLAQAKVLNQPASWVTKGWQEVVSLEQGVSLKVPAGNVVETNDQSSLTVSQNSNSYYQDPRWLSLTPYDAKTENELALSLSTSTPIAFLVGDKFLTGRQGTLAGSGKKIYILRIRSGAENTHLLWIRDTLYTNRILDILATLRFKA